MDKRFAKEVIKLMPEFAVSGPYFYNTPVDHVLCGFVYEGSPSSGAYIWKFVFPLYDRFDGLHLSFGDRLPPPHDFMETVDWNKKELAAEFVKRVQPFKSEVASLSELDRFAEYIEKEIGLVNPTIHRGYAATLIMLGRADEAKSELSSLCSSDLVKRKPKALEELSELRSDLSAGLGVARKTLEKWEQETKRHLGLNHRNAK